MKEVEIHTDGSCLGNPGPGGWACLLELSGTSHRRELAGGYALTTNNRMELMAAIEALACLKEPCRVRLGTDSQYLRNAVVKGWLYSWQKMGWRRKGGKPVPNADLWQRLLPLLKKHEVDFHWLKGHAGQAQNELCDSLAREFAQRKDLPPDPGYPGACGSMDCP